MSAPQPAAGGWRVGDWLDCAAPYPTGGLAHGIHLRRHSCERLASVALVSRAPGLRPLGRPLSGGEALCPKGSPAHGRAHRVDLGRRAGPSPVGPPPASDPGHRPDAVRTDSSPLQGMGPGPRRGPGRRHGPGPGSLRGSCLSRHPGPSCRAAADPARDAQPDPGDRARHHHLGRTEQRV